MRILYVGHEGGTCGQRAAALAELGHRVHHVVAGVPPAGLRFQLYRVGNRLRRPPDLLGANAAVRAAIGAGDCDLLWIDKGREIRAVTLAAVRAKSPRPAIVAYSPDDMLNPQNQSVEYLRSIPLYDLHVTTKSYNVAELRALGATDVMFVDNAFDPATHRPLELSPDEWSRYGAEVGFVGQFEHERAEWLRLLAERGLAVSVWGPDWGRMRERPASLVLRGAFLDGIDYAKAINATRVNLGFLRKVNRDLQTTRSVEIPACRAFMLAERTDEHLRLFHEGLEAEFFSSLEELEAKCRHYLEHEAERRAIAERGYARCIGDGYSNRDRLGRVVEHVARRYLPR